MDPVHSSSVVSIYFFVLSALSPTPSKIISLPQISSCELLSSVVASYHCRPCAAMFLSLVSQKLHTAGRLQFICTYCMSMYVSEPEGVTLAMCWNASLSNTCNYGFSMHYCGLQFGFKEGIALETIVMSGLTAVSLLSPKGHYMPVFLSLAAINQLLLSRVYKNGCPWETDYSFPSTDDLIH